MIFPSPFPPDVFYVWGEKGMPESSLTVRERELLRAGASEKRLRDFSLGRHCARTALRNMMELQHTGSAGMAGESGYGEVLRSKGRAPLWPDGILGSITHAGNYAAAAVARRTQYFGIGLDLERRRSGMHRLAARILRPEERDQLQSTPGSEQDTWSTTVFSAKESIYKALNPASGVYLGFQDASVELALAGIPEHGGFRWKLHKDCGSALKSGFEARGQYARRDNLVLTAVWVTMENLN